MSWRSPDSSTFRGHRRHAAEKNAVARDWRIPRATPQAFGRRRRKTASRDAHCRELSRRQAFRVGADTAARHRGSARESMQKAKGQMTETVIGDGGRLRNAHVPEVTLHAQFRIIIDGRQQRPFEFPRAFAVCVMNSRRSERHASTKRAVAVMISPSSSPTK